MLRPLKPFNVYSSAHAHDGHFSVATFYSDKGDAEMTVVR